METTTEDYEDHRTRLIKQPYALLTAWAVVGGLALTTFLGISGPASTVKERGEFVPAAFSQGEEGTLAAHTGMVPKPKE